MSTWGEKLGKSSANFRDIGEGVSVPPGSEPKYESIIYKSWLLGMIASLSPENTPENAGRDLMDVWIELDDSLVRAPGVTEVEDVSPRSLRWLFQQSSLDYSTELVALDAPWLGFKGTGPFAFYNLGLADPGPNGWNAVNILGVLVFSDGSSATYARETGAAVVIDISADICARTFGNAFGRTFAGAYTDPIDGLQVLGIRWNGTSGLYNDWSGAGAGTELLIANDLQADKIVAIRPIGLDALAILCRMSLWIGYPTGQADRPADFRSRVIGVGCVSEPTATAAPDGVCFLADSGVVVFNQNECKVISEDINSELLPIDYTQLAKYKGLYIPDREIYILQTPFETWFYEFPEKAANGLNLHPGRWTRRSFVFDTLVAFSSQQGGLFWADVQGTWDDQTLTWNEMVQTDGAPASELYIGEGSVLGVEDPAAETYLGDALDPNWETGQKIQEEVSEQVSPVGFEIEYLSNSAAVLEIKLPDSEGDFNNSVTKNLASSGGKRRRGVFWYKSTGQGAKMQIKILSGSLRLYRIKQIITDSGPALAALT